MGFFAERKGVESDEKMGTHHRGESSQMKYMKKLLGSFGSFTIDQLRQVARAEFGTFVSVTLGTTIICFSIVALIVPYQFAGTGVTGIALLTNYLWGISPVWVITVGNTLLLLWGWRSLSMRFALWTLYVTVLTSALVPIFELFSYPVIENTILAAILAGVVGGLGFGLLFRVDACSGGTDVVVMVVRKRWGIDVGIMSFYINITILICSIAVVNLEQLLMGALLLYIETLVIDNVVRSFDRRTQMLIVSAKHQEVSDFVMNELGRTSTLISAKGAYHGIERPMVLVVLSRRQAVELKRHIASIDPLAFVVLSQVSEVLGEGFKGWSRA